MLNATTVLYKSYRSGMFANHYLFIPIDSYGKWDKSRGKPGRHKEEVLCNTAKSLHIQILETDLHTFLLKTVERIWFKIKALSVW